jgi:hypothetical protein
MTRPTKPYKNAFIEHFFYEPHAGKTIVVRPNSSVNPAEDSGRCLDGLTRVIAKPGLGRFELF